MNPQWIQTISNTIHEALRRCPHCQRSAAYAQKRSGQFHTCKHCGHRFKEKGAATQSATPKRD
jgi:ribosomal protein L37AE/L43A